MKRSAPARGQRFLALARKIAILLSVALILAGAYQLLTIQITVTHQGLQEQLNNQGSSAPLLLPVLLLLIGGGSAVFLLGTRDREKDITL